MAIALVAHTGASSTTNNNVTTSAIDTTGATLLVFVISDGGSATISDSKGNSWGTANIGPSGGSRAQSRIFSVKSPTVGTGHTFTASSTGAGPSIEILAFSGTDTSANVDQTNSASAVSAANLAPGSITPSVNNEVVVTGFAYDPGLSASITNDSNFTITDVNQGAGGQAWAGAAAYSIQTTAAAVNPNWSTGAGSADGATIASFKAAVPTGTKDVTTAAALSTQNTQDVGTAASISLIPLSITPRLNAKWYHFWGGRK